MLQSIYAIGREISQGRNPWFDIVEAPYTDKNKKDKGKSLFTLELHFNLDTGEVEASPEDLSPFEDDKESLVKWACIPVQPANHNAFYVAMDAQKLEFLSHSFFGKPTGEAKQFPESGQFLKAIQKITPEMEPKFLGLVLKKMPLCRDSFLALLTDDKGELSVKKLAVSFFNPPEGEKKKAETERIVLVTSSITCTELGLAKCPMRCLDGYEAFIGKYFKFAHTPKRANAAAKQKRLCYASGQLAEEVSEAEFTGRDNLTSLFVKTTMNYATGFQKSAYHQNYQVSSEIGKFLERGAVYLKENQTCVIAGIRHTIVPQFFRQETYPVEGYMKPLKAQGDLLFKPSELGKWENYFADNVDDDIPEIYWLNFVATDVIKKKSLKVSGLIKDVSKFHFRHLLKTFAGLGDHLAPWLGRRYGFNLYSMYQVIPVREDAKKEKTNRALALFSALLEQRQVEIGQLFADFSQFVRCHWFDQFDSKAKHRAFPNIRTNLKQDNPQKRFDYAVKEGVFRYLAFWLALRQLNLLKENQPVMQGKKLTAEEIAASQEAFCERLGYSDSQESMFYLGRVLSRIVYEQSWVKKHRKNALDKLNYNGMDKNAIVRFSEDLFEASRHYDITGNIVWSWSKFSGLFNPEGWIMNPQEALFFILTGYTWGIKSKKGEETGLAYAPEPNETDDETESSDND